LIDLWKLKWFLFQFPSKAVKDQIIQCLKFWRGYTNVDFYLELRNLALIEEFSNWDNLKFLKSINASLVYVDWKFRNLELIYDWKDLGFKNCYFRFHWRWERLYDRLYTQEELDIFVEKIKDICKNKDNCFIFFNNTVKAQAVQNAMYFKNKLNG